MKKVVVVKGHYNSWEIHLVKTRIKKDGSEETYLQFWKNPGNLEQLADSMIQTQLEEGVVYYDTEAIVAALKEAEANVLAEIKRWLSETNEALEIRYDDEQDV